MAHIGIFLGLYWDYIGVTLLDFSCARPWHAAQLYEIFIPDILVGL